MKNGIAGLALLGTTLISGCMNGTTGDTAPTPTPEPTATPTATYATRDAQVNFIVTGGGVSPPSTTPTGQATFSGIFADSNFIAGYQNSDLTQGVTGGVEASVDFANSTLDMQMSNFNSASGAISGSVAISADLSNHVSSVSGSYDGTDVASATLTNFLIGDASGGGLGFVGGVSLSDANSNLLLDGSVVGVQNQ